MITAGGSPPPADPAAPPELPRVDRGHRPALEHHPAVGHGPGLGRILNAENILQWHRKPPAADAERQQTPRHRRSLSEPS